MGGVLLAVVGIFAAIFGRIGQKTADTGACRAVGSAFCRHFICGAVSDSARNLWKKYALRDGISGGHNDEHDKNNRRLFKEDRCFHACHLVFHAAPLSVAATVLSAALLSDALSADVLSAVPFEPHPASMETVSPMVNNTLNAFFIFFILLYHYLIEIHE